MLLVRNPCIRRPSKSSIVPMYRFWRAVTAQLNFLRGLNIEDEHRGCDRMIETLSYVALTRRSSAVRSASIESVPAVASPVKAT